MKTIRNLILTSFALLATAVALWAKPIPDPKGGRILTTEAPHAEFFVGKDRAVVVSFYDRHLKPVPVSGKVVSATAEAKSTIVGPTIASTPVALSQPPRRLDISISPVRSTGSGNMSGKSG